MPKGFEIVETYNLDRLEFVKLITKNKLVSMWELETINWEKERNAFAECKQNVHRIITNTHKLTNALGEHSYSNQCLPFLIKHSQVVPCLWSILNQCFSRAFGRSQQLYINPRQYEILATLEWGPAAVEIISLNADYEKKNVETILGMQQNQTPTKTEIGESERKTWLKIILLLSYSLALELKGDSDWDLLNKKGEVKINTEKLAAWLKFKAAEMFPQQDNPSFRCGKTTIDKILQEAEEELTPDIHTFVSAEK